MALYGDIWSALRTEAVMTKKEYRALAAEAAGGDARAFSRLYELVYDSMYYSAFYTLKNDSDAVEAVLGAARDGFRAIGRLHTEDNFRLFMMRTLCSRIKGFFKEYGPNPETDDFMIVAKSEMFQLENRDRLCAALYMGGNCTPDEIAMYTGMARNTVKKRLGRALDILDLDLK